MTYSEKTLWRLHREGWSLSATVYGASYNATASKAVHGCEVKLRTVARTRRESVAQLAAVADMLNPNTPKLKAGCL